MILGETLEQQRFFEQALAGREDLLGRRADGAGTGDGVMPTRWVGVVRVGRPSTPSRRSRIGSGTSSLSRPAAIAFGPISVPRRGDRVCRDSSSPASRISPSPNLETWPVGEGPKTQNLYLNAVAVGETDLSPARAARRAAGHRAGVRPRAPVRRTPPRTLDLDLDPARRPASSIEPGLEVPHPRFRERFFVLGPLAEVAPDLRRSGDRLDAWRSCCEQLLRDESR